jgi:hypothetical protein
MLEWKHLMQGRQPDPEPPPQNPAAPFTFIDRLRIDAALGSRAAPPDEREIEDMIAALPGRHSADRDGFARTHIREVLYNPEYRRQLIDMSVAPDKIIRPVALEYPKNADAYSLPELISFILHDEDLDQATRQQQVEKLQSEKWFRDYVAQQKRKEDKRLFRQVPKTRCLQSEDGEAGIITDVRDDLYNELFHAGMISYTNISDVSKAVNIATSKLAGMMDGEDDQSCCYNDGPLDNPGYHYELIVPSTRRRIKELAVMHLIRKGVIGGALYRDVI